MHILANVFLANYASEENSLAVKFADQYDYMELLKNNFSIAIS
jgi:hypothetical protein